MSETPHTPGPWVSTRAKYPQDGEYDFAIGAAGKVIAEAFGRVAEGDAGLRPAEANARLIAASPELLEAAKKLEQAEDFYANDCEECCGEGVPESCPVCFPLFDDARLMRRAAIAKAEGRAP